MTENGVDYDTLFLIHHKKKLPRKNRIYFVSCYLSAKNIGTMITEMFFVPSFWSVTKRHLQENCSMRKGKLTMYMKFVSLFRQLN